ncbi:MAG: GTP-binding protein [Granulosicoccus sp.]
MKSALPVTIISGYLGSGKTTLVNHLLRHANGVRLAVLVNDFGELPIDADLIEAQEGDVISLSGGCVCCSYGDDLSLSLQKLQFQAPLPDHVFIEASGVALPGAIGRSLSLQRAYSLQGIVVLADATSVQDTASEKYIGDTLQRQLIDADLIVLNKLDLSSASQSALVKQWLSENYPHAPVIGTQFSTVDPDILFEPVQLGNPQRTHRQKPPCGGKKSGSDHTGLHHEHAVSTLFSSINLKIDRPVDASALATKLADKQCGLIRAKGFVLNSDNTMKTIQVVGRRCSVSDAPAGVSTGLVCIAPAGKICETDIRFLCELD